jgi:undecaprenyl-diphosphatase
MAAIRLEAVQDADKWVNHMLSQVRTPFVNQIFLFITDLGASKVLIPLVIIVGLLLMLKKKIIPSFLLFLLYFFERETNDLLKVIIKRHRPLENPLVTETSYSFPSGHSMNSASIYLFIAFLLITYVPFFCKRKTYIWVIAGILVFLIGLSRMYIGVHFLTDVIAGWSLGFVFYLLFKKIDERLLSLRQK